MKTSLKLLDEIHIAEPCPVSWDGMTGNDRVRHCRECNQQVFDLSALTAEEGVRLIEESEGRVCVRFYRRTDGKIVTRDCVSARCWIYLRRSFIRATGAVASLLAFALTMVGCGWDDNTSSRRDGASQGKPGPSRAIQGKVDTSFRGESKAVMGGIAPAGNNDGQPKADET